MKAAMMCRPGVNRCMAVLVALAATTALCAHAAPSPVPKLLGMAQPPQLVSVQEATGAIRTIGSVIPNESQSQQLSAYDRVSSTYYILGYNETKPAGANLVGLGLDGSVVSSVKLPFVTGAFIGTGDNINVEPTSGHVLVSGRLAAGANHSILLINPRTGDYVVKGEVGHVSLLSAVSAYHPPSDTLYLVLGETKKDPVAEIFGVSLKDGSVSRTTMDMERNTALTTLCYNAADKMMYGWGISGTPGVSIVRTVARFDPTAGKVERVFNVTDYLVISGAIGPIDESNGLMYGMMQKTNANDSDPFHLVGVSLTDGHVHSAPVLGTIQQLPWSLEYTNP